MTTYYTKLGEDEIGVCYRCKKQIALHGCILCGLRCEKHICKHINRYLDKLKKAHQKYLIELKGD
jgi:hypothetical protein